MSEEFDTTRDSDGAPAPVEPRPDPPPADPDPLGDPEEGFARLEPNG